MILETFKGTILSSGRYRGYWKGSNGSYNYTITWDSVCKGSDELYAFLNNIDEGTKNIDNNKLYAASSGTGFFVSSLGHMITNHHVIDKCNPIKTIYNGKEFDTTTLAIDQNNDLAIIKADIKPKKHFAVSNNDAQLLEDVVLQVILLVKMLVLQSKLLVVQLQLLLVSVTIILNSKLMLP